MCWSVLYKSRQVLTSFDHNLCLKRDFLRLIVTKSLMNSDVQLFKNSITKPKNPRVKVGVMRMGQSFRLFAHMILKQNAREKKKVKKFGWSWTNLSWSKKRSLRKIWSRWQWTSATMERRWGQARRQSRWGESNGTVEWMRISLSLWY